MLLFNDLVGRKAADNYGWLSSQMVDPGRITPCGRGEPRRFQGAGLKVTVNPGDFPIPTAGERNEFLCALNANDADVNDASGTQFIAISLFLPVGWKDTAGWCIPLQLHAPDDNPSNASSPAFELDISGVPGHYTLNQRGGPFTDILRPDTDLGTHLYGQWVDFLFEIRWAADETGYTAAWTRVNGKGLTQQQVGTGKAIRPRNGPTLYSKDGIAQSHYWKRGCYRNSSDFTTVFYTGPLAIATTMAEAEAAAFG